MMQRVLFIVLFIGSFMVFASDTILKLYRPFGEVNEQVAPVVKSQVNGLCDGQSHLILREDAWHCQAGDKIYDPCFVKQGGNKMEAVCPQSPWVGDSVQINVTTPLNNENHSTLDMSRIFPWGIELTNGEHCQAIESTEVFDAMPVRYRCSGQNVLVGYLQRCKSVWSMLQKTLGGVVTVELSRAWF